MEGIEDSGIKPSAKYIINKNRIQGYVQRLKAENNLPCGEYKHKKKEKKKIWDEHPGRH
jgi:hypothetical protein